MKLKYFALFMAVVMAMALTGCSANRDKDSAASDYPVNSPTSDYEDRSSAGLDDGAYYSDNVGGDYGDAPGASPYHSDGVIDDIGDAAGDLARGAGDAVRDVGDAIGDAAGGVGRAMR
ncbi:MAG: hypothetical protein HFF29_01295 [Oscillospiraceae bacterium]|nr:hypothetical protein [Oscillospiraceae bacterium]